MNTAASILMFLLGCGGLALTLLTSLRRHSRAVELGVVWALLMLIPTAAADSVPVRCVLGCLCYVCWLCVAVYFKNFRRKNHRCRKR